MADTMNAIGWHEIPVTDIRRAETFYKTLFGWKFIERTHSLESLSTGGRQELMFHQGQSGGCLVEVKEEDHVTAFNSLDKKNKQKFGIRLTIQVEDVDEKIKEIEEAGGELWLPKEKVGEGMGYVIYFLDTEKNVMGIYSNPPK